MIKKLIANHPLLKAVFILSLKIGTLKILFTPYFKDKMETVYSCDKKAEDIY